MEIGKNKIIKNIFLLYAVFLVLLISCEKKLKNNDFCNDNKHCLNHKITNEIKNNGNYSLKKIFKEINISKVFFIKRETIDFYKSFNKLKNIEDVNGGEYCDFIFIIDNNDVLHTIRGSCDEDLLGYDINENILLNFDSDIQELNADGEINIVLTTNSIIITPIFSKEIKGNNFKKFKF